MFSSLFLFWEPASLGILYWLKILAAFWEAEIGHHDWFSHHNICRCWAGGLHKPKPHSCPRSCWQSSLESCAGRWSGPQKGEEGKGRERGREKWRPWEPLVLVSTSWLSNNHLSQTSCMNWTEWPNTSSPYQSLSYVFLYVSSCFFPHRDAQSKYFHAHQPYCPSLNILLSSSAYVLTTEWSELHTVS